MPGVTGGRRRPGPRERGLEVLENQHKPPLYRIANYREKIQWRLAQATISQAELARRMGITVRRAKLLLVARRMTEATLSRLSAALGCSLESWRQRLVVPQSPALAARRAFEAEAMRRLGLEKSPQEEKFSLHPWLR